MNDLIDLLDDLREYMANRADASCEPGDDRFRGNAEMGFQQRIDTALAALTKDAPQLPPSQVSKSADHASATGASGVEASAKGPLTPSFTEGEGRTRDEAIRRWSAKVAWLEECAGKLAVLGLQTANADLVEYASGLTVTFPEGAPRVKAPDFENLEGRK